MKTKYILLVPFILVLNLLLSCNDSFMDREPVTDLTESVFFQTENDVQLGLNTFYLFYFRGYDRAFAGVNPVTGASGSAQFDYPRYIPPFHLMLGDLYTDNMVNIGSSINARYNGTHVVGSSDSNGNTGWTFNTIYKINWFLENFVKAPISDDLKNRYRGEALFFKAWEYYNKVLFFGDVHWLANTLTTESPELYTDRTPRAEVMDSVLYCLNYAVQHLPEPTSADAAGRVNRDHANALKARICLFEGTFRKYHTELNLQSTANKFLEEAVTASSALINSGRYGLYNDGTDQTYWNMFILKGSSVPHNEAIIARVYDGTQVGHYSQLFWYENNRSVGATKGLVDDYLCIDGNPIYTGGSKGNYTPSPMFKGYDHWSEMDNRDPRLRQSIMKPGEYFSIWDAGTNIMDAETNGVVYPTCAYTGTGSVPTGYRIIKHWMPDNTQHASTGTQIGVELRYAEILLAYAEAKYELYGTLGQDDLDLTINALRERAGFDFSTYPNSRLTLANIPNDPRLDGIYADKLEYSVSPLLREIRRERRVELALEDLRYPDLMRWKAGPLMTVPLRGINFESVKDLYDGSNNLYPTVAPELVIGKDVYVDDEGFLIIYPLDSNFPEPGVRPWGDYQYYWPIPKGEFILNPNLTANPGWN